MLPAHLVQVRRKNPLCSNLRHWSYVALPSGSLLVLFTTQSLLPVACGESLSHLTVCHWNPIRTALSCTPIQSASFQSFLKFFILRLISYTAFTCSIRQGYEGLVRVLGGSRRYSGEGPWHSTGAWIWGHCKTVGEHLRYSLWKSWHHVSHLQTSQPASSSCFGSHRQHSSAGVCPNFPSLGLSDCRSQSYQVPQSHLQALSSGIMLSTIGWSSSAMSPFPTSSRCHTNLYTRGLKC